MDRDRIPQDIRWIAEADRDAGLTDAEIDLVCNRLNDCGPWATDGKPDNTDPIQALIEEHADGNSWGEHVDYPREDWRSEVDNRNTSLGYWEWVLHRIEDTANDAEHDAQSAADQRRLESAPVRPHFALSSMLDVLSDDSQRLVYLTNAMCEHASGDQELLKKHGLR